MRIWLAMGFACALGCGGGSSSKMNSADMAHAADLATTVDLAHAAADGGALPFGAACTMDNQCATGSCFIGGMMSFCTMPCTAATAATDCPSPPTSGTCNMRGFCKP